jgi:tetratricopeptide (TPR) repeat protein
VARADRRRAAREARHARNRPTTARARAAAEQQMFFPKLRAQARWVFVFLAIVFAAGFAFLGVGSGSNLGDVLSNFTDIFQHGPSASSAVKKAQKEVRKHPDNAQAYRDLATAYETDNKTDRAILALERYTKLRPKDTDALNELGSLYLTKGDNARNRGQSIQLAASTSFTGSIFGVSPNSKIGKALSGTADPSTGTDPVEQSVATLANDRANKAYSEMSNAYSKAVAAYRSVATVTPNDALAWLQLGQASEQANDTTTAISAYQRYLKLAPDDPNAPAVRKRIKDLQKAPASPQAAG